MTHEPDRVLELGRSVYPFLQTELFCRGRMNSANAWRTVDLFVREGCWNA
jgi:hypothetical protein